MNTNNSKQPIKKTQIDEYLIAEAKIENWCKKCFIDYINIFIEDIENSRVHYSTVISLWGKYESWIKGLRWRFMPDRESFQAIKLDDGETKYWLYEGIKKKMIYFFMEFIANCINYKTKKLKSNKKTAEVIKKNLKLWIEKYNTK